MIYDISREGAAELRRLGSSLEDAISDINDQIGHLRKGVENERCDIGLYYGFLVDHIGYISEKVSKYESDIKVIAHNLYDKADQIDGIVADVDWNRYNAYMNHEVRRLVNHSSAVKTVRNNETNGKGEKKGHYEGDIFFFNDEYVPNNQFNPAGKNIGEIREDLRDKYGIELNGIPVADGEADFSSIAVARVSYSQIMKKVTGKSLGELEAEIDKCRLEPKQNVDEGDSKDPVEMRLSALRETFGKNDKGYAPRSRNFEIADSIVAELQLDIPGLKKPYSKEDVKKWRQENNFSWDEQLDNGYILVPSVIHAEIQHRGLVGYASSAVDEYEREQQYVELHASELYWNEADAPISITELKQREGK